MLQQLAAEDLGDLLGIGFAFGELHDLAGEEIDELLVAGPDLLDLGRIVGDGAVAQVGPKVVTGKPAKALKASVGAGYLSSVRAIRQATELVGEELNA
jgi:hypothetical protein